MVRLKEKLHLVFNCLNGKLLVLAFCGVYGFEKLKRDSTNWLVAIMLMLLILKVNTYETQEQT